MLKPFTEINVGPFATNVLDLIGREDLETEKGATVRVSQIDTSFFIQIGLTEPYSTTSNIAASYYLNHFPIGTRD